jgi:hypothetical protein
MRRPIAVLLLVAAFLAVSCARQSRTTDTARDVVVENDQFRLVITSDGIAKSLLYKPGNIECLMQGRNAPISTLTLERPYQNEVKLAYPTKETTFKANAVRREGDTLIVGFELEPWEARIHLKITPDYIGFRLDDFRLNVANYGIDMTEPPVSEMWFLQLPVRDREHYGDWLNVVWDDSQAVNLLGTDPYARIDSEEREGYRVLKAGVHEKAKLNGVGAALIACPTDKLLDTIARVEEDFRLPRGVQSRRHELYNASYYWSGDVVPGNVDEHIRYARMGGFRTFMLYYPCFIEGNGYRKLGNYDWRAEYPNGKEDLRRMLDKIKAAGMVPGFHFLHSHIGRDSRYVTPKADHRLNLLKVFTLAKPLRETDTTIYVEQNPQHSTMTDNRRVLKIGTELISYAGYTTSPPYSFTGCVRGIDGTTVAAQPAGYMLGLLDVSEFGATSIYVDQNSSLQDEIAAKLADIYDAGFRFLYFDGSEGVNPPFWLNVPLAQWRVYKRLQPEPIFAEGAAKAHFSWHMLTGGNAFDVFAPEVLKESIRKHPADEAPRMRNNFTRVNFGWLGYWVPDEKTVGTQPDMIEYVTSRAAAWDCPISIQADLSAFARHARTADNFEVIRRWEEARARHWLTREQKQALRNLGQEHILLLNEKNELELAPYDEIPGVANGSREIRAFTFSRGKDLYAVYWHISGDRRIELDLRPGDFTLMETLGRETKVESGRDGKSVLPAGARRYIKARNLSKAQLLAAFKTATIHD